MHTMWMYGKYICSITIWLYMQWKNILKRDSGVLKLFTYFTQALLEFLNKKTGDLDFDLEGLGFWLISVFCLKVSKSPTTKTPWSREISQMVPLRVESRNSRSNNFGAVFGWVLLFVFFLGSFRIFFGGNSPKNGGMQESPSNKSSWTNKKSSKPVWLLIVWCIISIDMFKMFSHFDHLLFWITHFCYIPMVFCLHLLPPSIFLPMFHIMCFYTQKYTFFPQPAWTTVSLSFTNTWSWRTSLTHSFDRSVCHWWSSCPLNSRTVASGDTCFWEEKTLGARSFVGFCGFPWIPKKTTGIVKESRNDSKGWEALQFLRESLTKTRFCV